MANSPVVTSLPAYIDAQRVPLITKTVLGAKSAKLFTLIPDVKSTTALNLLSTDIAFGDGASCGWTENGTATLSQRTIDPAYLKVNMAYCDKQLLGKWAAYEVQVAAGDATLPFEEQFVNDVLDGINAELEKLIWTGKKASGNQFDGIVTILEDEGDGIKVSIPEGTGAYEAIKAVYAKIPSSIVMKNDCVIFVSEGIYAQFIQDLVAANLYHFNPTAGNGEYVLPGTNIRVIAVGGLNGTGTTVDTIVAGRLSNFFYGCAFDGDSNAFDLWYSKDNQEFRLAANFNAGVQVAYPNEVVIGTEQA